MASITISGILTIPTSGLAAGDKIRFTHKSTTGDTLLGAVSTDYLIPPDGSYTFELQYGLIQIDTWTFRNSKWVNQGTVTVNDDQTATTLPELLNSAIPATPLVAIRYQIGSLANPEYQTPWRLHLIREIQ